jgi:predicted glycosyltransferase involved in capsule biosynthesis
MIDLTDVTFTIPIRYDTDDRIRNIVTTLSYLLGNFNTNIIILESDSDIKMRPYIEKFFNKNVKYMFIKEDSDIFHRTKFLNIMAKEAETEVISNYDADIILPIPQYIIAKEAVKNGTLDACTAFSSITFNVKKEYHKRIEETKSINWMNLQEMTFAPHKHAVAKGGVVFWNKKKFIEVGMENENFISWGPEDQERVERCLKLGYKWGRAEGLLLHLDHDRLLNSDGGHRFIQQNDAEFEKIKSFTKEQLQEYVKGFSWTK